MTSYSPCAFCGRTDQRLTKEHVYPRHWGGYFTGLGADKVARVSRVGGVSSVVQKGASTQFDNQVRDICGICNAGWMRELDEAVKPFVVPLALGQTQTIDQAQGALFQSWATKIALVRTLQDRAAGQQAAQDRFSEFFVSRLPFGPLVVQASSCAPNHLDSNDSMVKLAGSEALSNVVSVAMGHLFFQVGLFDPTDDATRTAVRADLAMIRRFTEGRVQLVTDRKPTVLQTALTDTEIVMVREVHALAGRSPATENTVHRVSGKQAPGAAFGNPNREPRIRSIPWVTYPEN